MTTFGEFFEASGDLSEARRLFSRALRLADKVSEMDLPQKARILRGDKYAKIAADYRINQGRIADLKFGRIFRDVEPADISQ